MGRIILWIVIGLLAAVVITYLYLKLHPTAFDDALKKSFEQSRSLMKKDASARIGRRLEITREGKDNVLINLYEPRISQKDHIPVFIAHGGQFVDGDADQIDTFCEKLSELSDAVVFNINYAPMDSHPFPYPQEEIADTVLYCGMHAESFGIDIHKTVLAGFSSGAYLMTGAAALLKEKDFIAKGLIQCDPVIDDALVNLCIAGLHPSPVSIYISEKDPMFQRLPTYREYMGKAGVECTVHSYADAYPGFIERNNPEFTEKQQFAKDKSISEEQREIAGACMIHISGDIREFAQ